MWSSFCTCFFCLTVECMMIIQVNVITWLVLHLLGWEAMTRNLAVADYITRSIWVAERITFNGAWSHSWRWSIQLKWWDAGVVASGRSRPKESKVSLLHCLDSSPVVSWLARYIGHVGIAREDGIVIEFGECRWSCLWFCSKMPSAW